MGFTYTAIILTLVCICGKNVAIELDLSLPKVLNTTEYLFLRIAAQLGLQAEVKDVVTEDGYVLTLFHIHGDEGVPVLAIHGNTASADCWIIREKESMAYKLAQKRRDQWFINLRGSRYSRRHQRLNADKQPEQFFNFTFYEQGVHDIPATVDFILQQTGQKELAIIGHSVGTTVTYVMGSEKPEYNDKVKIAISLSPICYLENVRGFASLANIAGPPLLAVADLLRIHEVVGYQQFGPLLKVVCSQFFGYELCIKLVVFGVFGYDEKGLEPAFVPKLFDQFPAGSSVKMFKHLLQVVQKKEFVKYDYGKEKNLKLYNSAEPPPFDLSKVTMKTALFMGREDFLGTVQDSVRLNESLPSVLHYQVLPYEKFNHADFIWGRYMSENLFPYLFDVLDKYK